MPISGVLIGLVIALLFTQLGARNGLFALLFGTGAIFPLALLVACFRGESLTYSNNPFAKLMGLCVGRYT